MPIAQIATIGALFAFTLAPIVNLLPAAGEELGWRGYLLARLQPLGPRRAALVVGLIWGIWHAPVIMIGHNYPNEPALGPLLMIVLTLAYGVILAWLRARSGSIWPAALAHGTLNAQGGAVAMFLTPANPLVGAPIGLVALIPTLLLALALLRFAPWEPSTSSRAPIGRDY